MEPLETDFGVQWMANDTINGIVFVGNGLCNQNLE